MIKNLKAAWTFTDVRYTKRIKNILSYYLFKNGYCFLPSIIWLKINNFCNLKCKMCNLWKNLNIEKQHMSIEVLKKIIDDIKKLKFKPLISINTVEPLLHGRITDIAYYIVKSGLELKLVTNGFLLEKFANEFVDIGIQRLWVSLDGPPHIHDEIRGVKGSFEKAIQGVKLIQKKKRGKKRKYPRVATSYTISNYNYHSLGEYMRSIKNVEFELVLFTHMNFITEDMLKSFRAESENLLSFLPKWSAPEVYPREVDINVLHKQISSVKRKYGDRVCFLPELDYESLKAFYYSPETFVKKRCRFPWIGLQFDTQGNSFPFWRCLKFNLGNIKNDDFEKIWNGERIRTFRRTLRNKGAFPICSRCCGNLSSY